MELYTLKINVTNQRLSFGENPPEIYSGDQSIDFVEFTFTDDTWNFPNIWAIFYRQKGVAYQIALDDNKVMIPAEVMQKRGYVYIGLMATDGENVQTSSVLQYSIRQGAANVDTISPSPNIYEQFLADLDAYQEAIHNLENLAATAETLPAGSDATATYDNGVLELGIPKGDTGATGNGIASITKTGTSGSVDTYTITYTNGQTATFTVTNGAVTSVNGMTGDVTLNGLDDIPVILNGGYLPVPFTYINGGYIDQTNGDVVSYSSWKYTDFIDISGREENKLYLMTDGAKSVYNCFYDADKSFISPVNDDHGEIPSGFIPSNAKYIRLSCKSTATQTLKLYKTPYVTEYELSKKLVTEPVIKVANFNVGLFNNGISGVSAADAPQQMIEFRKIIGGIDADIFNTQEFQQYFDIDSTYLARDDVMKFKYPYDTYDVRYYGSLGFSKNPIMNAGKTNFQSGSGKYYIHYDVEIQNKTITIIDAHLAIEEDASIHRQSEIAELITYMNTKDYVILTGDFNVYSQTEYNAFTVAGYTLCNGGDFGWFDTWPIYGNMPTGWSTQWPCNNLDNIIVSSNIVPQNVEAYDCGISDHAPFIAQLRID